jgi:hypothetical protein
MLEELLLDKNEYGKSGKGKVVSNAFQKSYSASASTMSLKFGKIPHSSEKNKQQVNFWAKQPSSRAG